MELQSLSSKKIVLLFPGQGSQYKGMGELIKDDPMASESFELADEALDFSLTDLMFYDPKNQLNQTEFTQPAIVAHSVALFSMIQETLYMEKGLQIDYVLGHSVGEYSALVAARALPFSKALHFVNKRGQFMQQSVPVGVGGMAAVLRSTIEIIEAVCTDASSESEIVMPANFNAQDQVVISGHLGAIEKFKTIIKERDPKARIMPLKVSAPFHSSLMSEAAKNLDQLIATDDLTPNKFSYIANIDAKTYGPKTDPAVVRQNLISQVEGSVRWIQSLESLPIDTAFIEVGPGKVLSNIVKKAFPDRPILTMDKCEDLLNHPFWNQL